jgi:hypothetical protein
MPQNPLVKRLLNAELQPLFSGRFFGNPGTKNRRHKKINIYDLSFFVSDGATWDKF